MMTLTTTTTQFQTIEEVDEDGAATVLTEIGAIAGTTDMGMGLVLNMLIDPQAGTMTVNGEEMPLPEAARAAGGKTQPPVVSPRGQLLETKEARFYTQLRERKALLEVDLSGVRAEILGLRKAIAIIDGTIREQPEVVVRLQTINDEIASYREIRANLKATRDGLKTRSLELRETALVISKARPPRRPAFPKTGLNMAVAGIAGLLVGVVYELLLEDYEGRRRRRGLANLDREVRAASRPAGSSGSTG